MISLSSLFQKLTDTTGGGHKLPNVTRFFMSMVSGYNHEKYWKRRTEVINPNSKVCALLRIYYLLYIKRVDCKHLCSFGTMYNNGAQFVTPPHLPHGPNGIIVGYDAKIGANVTIYHQVTIPAGGVEIGDGTIIYPGAKLIQGVKVGKRCRIGANVVVSEDIPDGATVVPAKSRIVFKR